MVLSPSCLDVKGLGLKSTYKGISLKANIPWY